MVLTRASLLLLSVFVASCQGSAMLPHGVPPPTSTSRALEPLVLESLKSAVLMVKMPDGSQGSGVHYYKDGKRSLVLTAAHVVEPFPAGTGVNLWGVGLYGEHVEATAFVKKVGDQNNVDLAVLECPPLGSIPVPISKKGPWLPSQGDTLLSVGYPKGIYPPLVTLGYAVQMDGLYLDHTASVWFGNSGGPVVNTSLEVVGINVLVGGCEGGAHSDKVRAIRLSFIKDFVKGV